LPSEISSGFVRVMSLTKAITTDMPNDALLTAFLSSVSLLTATLLVVPDVKGETSLLNNGIKPEKITAVINSRETKDRIFSLKRC
jgi:hypothetical protein